jgi:predicted TIM-barrel fold metal-dependent hydrolase
MDSERNQMRIIDTDSHIIEPRDFWTARMSAKRWGDLVPHVEYDEGLDAEGWYVGDARIGSVGTSTVVSDSQGDAVLSQNPAMETAPRFDVIHPSAYDGFERIKMLDKLGIRAAVLYPNISLFLMPEQQKNLERVVNFDLGEYQQEIVRVWNDAVLDWISPDPSRFIPLASVPYWDVAAAVAEIERCASLGFKGIITTGAPHVHNQPFMPDPYWDPMWAAAQAHRMPISFHLGSGDVSRFLQPERMALEGPALTYPRGSVDGFLDNAIILNDLLFSGVLPRFPDLKFVVVESGIGWVPFCLEAADYQFVRGGDVRKDHPEFDMLPSEYFKRQVYTNFWFEDLQPWHVEKIGVENILFETDYPHPTCLFGDELSDVLERGFARVGASEREAILWRNAAELYGLHDLLALEAYGQTVAGQ